MNNTNMPTSSSSSTSTTTSSFSSTVSLSFHHHPDSVSTPVPQIAPPPAPPSQPITITTTITTSTSMMMQDQDEDDLGECKPFLGFDVINSPLAAIIQSVLCSNDSHLISSCLPYLNTIIRALYGIIGLSKTMEQFIQQADHTLDQLQNGPLKQLPSPVSRLTQQDRDIVHLQILHLARFTITLYADTINAQLSTTTLNNSQL